ncbi:metallophosphoesterase family protein [Cohnella abietis]|uniref:Serine/threonine protein phosphatase n=1 Tax=Cohnella abietis TaxID=2507935 RepID=A0A3T1D819_9BACL|nr:metallophosphoesterase family protein [Cohnella abietis]BBI34231.1 serine/threonine protein phosphatase [Cohnella abietis]
MEKIAIISDIHGNIPAFHAVLNDIKAREISRIFCLGDLVGKGPSSDIAVDLVQATCEKVVTGNWDAHVPQLTDSKTIKWHQNKLGKVRLDYLRGLPFSIEFYMSGKFVRLFHASPRSVHERIQPWDSYESRLSLFESSDLCEQEIEADVVGYGDIHNALIQNFNGKTLFNVGSVGNPLEIPQASYAILEGEYNSREPSSFSIQLVRVPYDIELAVKQALEEDMPSLEAYILELRTAQYRGIKK